MYLFFQVLRSARPQAEAKPEVVIGTQSGFKVVIGSSAECGEQLNDRRGCYLVPRPGPGLHVNLNV